MNHMLTARLTVCPLAHWLIHNRTGLTNIIITTANKNVTDRKWELHSFSKHFSKKKEEKKKRLQVQNRRSIRGCLLVGWSGSS